MKPFDAKAEIQLKLEIEDEESALLKLLKECKAVGTTSPSTPGVTSLCMLGDESTLPYFLQFYSQSGDNFLPINWNGRTFTVSGTVFSTAVSSRVVSLTGTFSEDGRKLESGQFHYVNTRTEYGTHRGANSGYGDLGAPHLIS